MPYTPPSHNSPSSSKSNSPTVSRSGSYSEDVPRSPASGRPQPPRSMSSTSYLHRHRRTPSLNSPDSVADVATADFAHMSSLRQSPPPVNNLRIPTGAVLSPPDSSENSDGDDSANQERGRELEKNWDQLQQAVRAIPQQREPSPEKGDTMPHPPATAPVSQSTSPTALSAEARKISHSRSSTEGKIILKASFAPVSTTISDDSDEEDDHLLVKPALVRKKSGELVKPALRPSSRRRYSSMPGTPTYHKSVHFNDSDNQTRHFLQVDKPIAVSAGSSPVEVYDSDAEYPFDEDEEKKRAIDIKIANFPTETFERRSKAIRVERIYLSEDKTSLIGTCVVQNISFQKQVVARFTLDYWKTTSEVTAEYQSETRQSPNDGCDRFSFQIQLSDQANIHTRTLLLCVRYNVGGQEFWDNNDNSNFQVDFVKPDKRPSRPSKPLVTTSLSQRPANAIPRSKHSPSSPHPRSDTNEDDFISSIDKSSYLFGNSTETKLFTESPSSSIRLKPKTKRTPMFSTGQSPASRGLGSRYDFGTSLSAALSTAQEKLGQQSGLMRLSDNRPSLDGSYFGPLDRTEPVTDHLVERPTDITSDRPAMGSEQYKDLVQKFCYFTPGFTGRGVGSPLQAPSTTTSTAEASPAQVDSATNSAPSSGTNSPVTPASLDGANDQTSSGLRSFVSRSTSPAPITGQSISDRAASPLSFGYPYHSNTRDGYLSDAPTPTAILG